MGIRYFTITSPRADYTGRVGGISFADGVARVSFDDTREKIGDEMRCLADEPNVQVGRSAVLFAQRRPGYTVVETDASGQPLPEPEDKPKRRTPAKPPTPPAGPPAPPVSPASPDDNKKEGEQK